MIYPVSLRSAAARPARLYGATAAGAVAMMLAAAPANAALVSACSGVRLQGSVISGLLQPLVTNGVAPIQTDVNALLGVTRLLPGGGILPATPLSFDGVGFLNNITNNGDVDLAVIKNDGTLFGANGDTTCNTTTDSLQLNTPQGISLGGNKITGLGSGTVATAGSLSAIALGNGATTTTGVPNAIALGTGASATVAGGVAIGAGSADKAATPTTGATIGGTAYTFAGTTPTSVVSVGTAGAERQIANVAAGQLSAGSTDAVNGSQLFATNTAVNANSTAIATNTTNIAGNTTAITNLSNGAAGTVQRNPSVTNSLLLTATGGTGSSPGAAQTLGNVAPGMVAAGSTDAVNGGQLAATNANVTTNTTNIAGNTTAITNLSTGINNGTVGLVQQIGGAPGNGTITVGAGTQGTVVDFTNSSGLFRTLSGVAAGVAPTDAVNVSQLTGSIGAATANAVQYDDASKTMITLGGVGAATPTTVTNVAPGALTPTSTDAVNGSQLAATNGNVTTNTTNIAGNTTAITNLTTGAAGTVQRTATANNLTLTAPGGTGAAPGAAQTLSNVAAGVAPTDAVNVGQLAATNANVTTNTTTINNLSTSINNGTVGLVQQTGGAPGAGQITVGAATGGTSVTIAGTDGNRTLTGLNAGVAANDAVTVAQLNGVTGGGLNNVQYDTNGEGGRSNTITLAGGAAGPVTITNVAPGILTAGSTDAVNGGELYAVNQQVQGLITGVAGAFQSNNAAGAAPPVASGANASAGGFGATATGAGSVALGNGATSTGTGSVALGQGSTDGGQSRVVSVGGVGSERRITNVAAAINSTDAVNLSQLQAATNSFTTTTNGLQNEINQTNFDLNQVRRRANGGTAGAMAAAGLPQAFEPGKSMIGGGIGYWADQVAFAVGVSTIVGERTVLKASGSISGQGVGGFNAGVGYQF